MPYIQHTWYAGDTVEIHKTYSARYGKKIARGPNRNKTTEDVKKYNAELAERELRMLLNPGYGCTVSGQAACVNAGGVLTKHLQSAPHTAVDIITAVYFLSHLRRDYSAATQMYGGKSGHTMRRFTVLP